MSLEKVVEIENKKEIQNIYEKKRKLKQRHRKLRKLMQFLIQENF